MGPDLAQSDLRGTGQTKWKVVVVVPDLAQSDLRGTGQTKWKVVVVVFD